MDLTWPLRALILLAFHNFILMLIILPFAAFALQMTREMTVNVIIQQQKRKDNKNQRRRAECGTRYKH